MSALLCFLSLQWVRTFTSDRKGLIECAACRYYSLSALLVMFKMCKLTSGSGSATSGSCTSA